MRQDARREAGGKEDFAEIELEHDPADYDRAPLIAGAEEEHSAHRNSADRQTDEAKSRNSDQSIRSPSKSKGMDKYLDTLPTPVHFSVLCLGVCVSFGAHNYLQESISRMDGFKGLGSILGYLEVIGVMVFSYIERWVTGETERKVQATSYMQLTCCLLGSSYLSTVGLDYINYPTKVVFRSCKLIPTMAVALVMNKERFSLTDITCAIAICAGLAMFAFADMTSVSKVSTAFGMALQATSTIADAFLPNLQQSLFKQGASTLEVTYYTNLYVFFIMTLMGGGTGHIKGAFAFVMSNLSNGALLVMYSVVAYWAISFHIRVVQRYGSVVAVLVGNLRKAGTIALSFLVFPKPFSWFYVGGTLLVFGGLTITAYAKDLRRREKAKRQQDSGGGVANGVPMQGVGSGTAITEKDKDSSEKAPHKS